MKSHFTLLCILGLLLSMPFQGHCKSPSLSKFYLSYASDKGDVYFVHPHKLQSTENPSYAPKNISWDFTYDQASDSVRLLVSIVEKTFNRPTNLILSAGDETIELPTTLLFAEPQKNDIHFRVEAYMPYEKFKRIFSQPQPPTLTVVCNDEQLRYTYSQKDWSGYSRLFRSLFQIISIQSKHE